MASEEAEKQFNKKATPHAFLPEQSVLLDEHSFLTKNQKLAPKWSGPQRILCLKGECNVKLLLWHNNKNLISNVNRLKPCFVPKTNAVASPDLFPEPKIATHPLVHMLPQADEIFFHQEMTTTIPRRQFGRSNVLTLPFLLRRSIILTLPLTQKTPGSAHPLCRRARQLLLASTTHFHVRHHYLGRSHVLTLPLRHKKH